MEKPILVGNSCGGGILHALGAEHPERLGGLVYLDAAEDPTLTLQDYPQIPVDKANLPKQMGKPPQVVFPEAERRQLTERPLDPAIRKAIVEDNNVRPAYARIRALVLAIYRVTTLQQALKDYPPETDQQRAALGQAYAARRGMLEKWQTDMAHGLDGEDHRRSGDPAARAEEPDAAREEARRAQQGGADGEVGGCDPLRVLVEAARRGFAAGLADVHRLSCPKVHPQISHISTNIVTRFLAEHQSPRSAEIGFTDAARRAGT